MGLTIGQFQVILEPFPFVLHLTAFSDPCPTADYSFGKPVSYLTLTFNQLSLLQLTQISVLISNRRRADGTLLFRCKCEGCLSMKGDRVEDKGPHNCCYYFVQFKKSSFQQNTTQMTTQMKTSGESDEKAGQFGLQLNPWDFSVLLS